MDMYQKREMRKNKKMNEDTKSLPSTSINFYPGHMAKTRRLIAEKYPLIDIVYEVVDARIPFSSKIKDIYNIIGNKPKILIMTKKDLCDEKITSAWVKYYENLEFHFHQYLNDLIKNKSLLNEEEKPLYNRTLASYAPGSSFKPVTGAIGLTTNAFTADENFGASGTKWQLSSDWKDFYITTLSTYSGNANLQNALIYSDNIYFAKAALKVGKENFAQSLLKIKFNQDIQMPTGSIKSSFSNNNTFETETMLANSGYGQAQMLVNPIHMATIYSAFVNDGNMVKPYIEYTKNVNISYLVKEAFSKEAANTIKNDLIQVVENPKGTAHSAKIEGLTIAGKTGTAEIKDSKEDKEGREIGWFNAFIAEENSDRQLIIISMVEDVQNKGGSHYVVNKVRNIF